MTTEIRYLEEFFQNFDNKTAHLNNEILTQSSQCENQIKNHIGDKNVEISLNISRNDLLSSLNAQFKFHLNIADNLFNQLRQLAFKPDLKIDELNDFKLILFKLKCKIFDFGLLKSDVKDIISETIFEIFYNDSNQIILNQLLNYVEKTFSNFKTLFTVSDLKLNVTYIGDIVIINDLINLAKCDYFHLYNIFNDKRLASEPLALDNYLNYKMLPLSPHQIFAYPKSFNQGCLIQLLDSNGIELFKLIKANSFQLVPYHFILTELYLIAVYYNSDDSYYILDLYDHRLNLIKTKQFLKCLNLIEINTDSIELKSVLRTEIFESIKIENFNFKIKNKHLTNRILFSYNNTYQSYILKLKSNDYSFKKIVSSHLQSSNKSLILASHSTLANAIVLEFTSYDKKYYDFANKIE